MGSNEEVEVMVMSGVLPEMKKGDVIQNDKGHTYRVNRVRDGYKFDEPLYRLETMKGVVLKRSEWTAEELTANGYRCITQEGDNA